METKVFASLEELPLGISVQSSFGVPQLVQGVVHQEHEPCILLLQDAC